VYICAIHSTIVEETTLFIRLRLPDKTDTNRQRPGGKQRIKFMVIGGDQNRLLPFCRGNGKGVGKRNTSLRL
jgi:hypothetical protein